MTSQQERLNLLEGQLAKESHHSSLPPSSDRFVHPPMRSVRQRAISLVIRTPRSVSSI
ncbi:DUF6444 domain-containing protein [Ktedonobacter robiniae]|uniref:DUF6444 domain-containing protein n=1 Tax=Ktedonobacter robiniae TaxID=2778365 RepID=UPI003B75CBB4